MNIHRIVMHRKLRTHTNHPNPIDTQAGGQPTSNEHRDDNQD